jgi:hypothetical protein
MTFYSAATNLLMTLHFNFCVRFAEVMLAFRSIF